MSKNLRSLLALTAMAVLATYSAGSALADPITTLYGTGLNADGTNASSASPDLHYTMTQHPANTGETSAVYAESSTPTGYLAALSGSQWIGPNADGNTDYNTGTYVFTTTFTLAAGLNLSTAMITGQIMADDTATISLNGNDVNLGGSPSYTAATSFTINSGFLTGTNTLQFTVDNIGPNKTPTSLDVSMSGTISPSVVPEPSSIALCGLAGLIGSAYAWRRRKGRRVA
jgi:hypothetical protein